MSIKSTIYSILSTDAQVNNAANLGGSAMLNQSGTAPYGVFYHHPPEEPTAPLITYHASTAIGEQPRLTAILITSWGGEIVTIADRIHALLNRKQLLLTAHRFLQLVWDWHSEELWQDHIELYAREDRYLVKTWKV